MMAISRASLSKTGRSRKKRRSGAGFGKAIAAVLVLAALAGGALGVWLNPTIFAAGRTDTTR